MSTGVYMMGETVPIKLVMLYVQDILRQVNPSVHSFTFILLRGGCRFRFNFVPFFSCLLRFLSDREDTVRGARL